METFGYMDASGNNDLHFSARNIGVIRDGYRMLHGIDWEVRNGEHWAILGQNGCGKTSLLKCLLGYLTPTTGEMTITARDEGRLNREPWDLWKRKFGFVSASVAQQTEPLETGIEIVMSGRYAMINYWRKRTPKEVRAEAEAILEKIECGHLAKKIWAVMSQGERQRLLIGRALMAADLRMLVLDEPCAGLDPVAREHFIEFVQRLTGGEDAPSLLLVTHHVEEIVPAITHAIVLKDGELLASGKKHHVITSRILSEAFGAELEVRHQKSRYRLDVQRDTDSPEMIV